MPKSVLAAVLIVSSFLLHACSAQQTAVPPQSPLVAAPNTEHVQVKTPDPPAQPSQTKPTEGSGKTEPGPAKSEPEQPKKEPDPPKPAKLPLPEPVRGIHVSGWYAGSPDLFVPLLDWAKEAGVNAVVLDVKAEDGKISWLSDVPLAEEIGANTKKVGDIEKVVQDLHTRGFWVVGRIVVMNDQFLYRARPAWGIPGFPGGAYSFMDPHNAEVWRYNLDIAKAAVRAGMDEIQFDYIRYPEKLINGYNRDTTAEFRTSAINGFLKKAMEELKPLGVYVSADLFGLTTSVEPGDDMQIGQDYRQVAEIVDFVSAMAYPSHYAPGTYGIANPDASPYETVKQSAAKAIERSEGLPLQKHRPWIQDFTYPSAGAHKYGPAEVLAQVKALKELGITSFMLWDPSNKYSRSVNFLKSSQ